MVAPGQITPEQVSAAAARWSLPLPGNADIQLAAYGNLLLRWNERLAMTAIRTPGELIDRHVMEGLFAAAHHPQPKGNEPAVLDFGSGTGVPGIPLAICRPELHVTLAESQQKKASFLREAVRQLGLRSRVHPGRAEALPSGSFDAVWMRAVERSVAMLPLAAALVSPSGALCLLSGSAVPKLPDWHWTSLPLPHSERRVLHIGTR